MPKISAGSSPAGKGAGGGGPRGTSPAAPPGLPGGGGKKRKKGGRASLKSLTQFTSQLSTLQDAGLPIVRSLRILEGQMKPCVLKNTLQEVANEVLQAVTIGVGARQS